MRMVLLTLLGATAIVAYAIYGLLLVNDWAVSAASGLPLAETIAEMDAAGQPYSAAAGFVFAGLGILLAVGWAVMAWIPRRRARGESLVTWAGVIALGAPAYFFASFGNLNSVGDTFPEWDAAAAFSLVAPLYAVSAVAFVVAVMTPILIATHRRAPVAS